MSRAVESRSPTGYGTKTVRSGESEDFDPAPHASATKFDHGSAEYSRLDILEYISSALDESASEPRQALQHGMSISKLWWRTRPSLLDAMTGFEFETFFRIYWSGWATANRTRLVYARRGTGYLVDRQGPRRRRVQALCEGSIGRPVVQKLHSALETSRASVACS